MSLQKRQDCLEESFGRNRDIKAIQVNEKRRDEEKAVTVLEIFDTYISSLTECWLNINIKGALVRSQRETMKMLLESGGKVILDIK